VSVEQLWLKVENIVGYSQYRNAVPSGRT